jgi:hypothetical protein
MEDNSLVISLLTAMITPAVLIMACGQLSLTTSQRLSRSISRTRTIYNELMDIKSGKREATVEEKIKLHLMITQTTKRSILLQKVMSMLYIALLFFVSTSLLTGIFEIMDWVRHWVLITVPIIGAIALFSASILLIMETRLALLSVENEMKYVLLLENEILKVDKSTHDEYRRNL